MSVRVAGFRSTTFLFIHLNAVTLEPPFVALPFGNRKTRSSPSKDVSLYEKNETTLPGSFTRNHSIHFADRTRKCNAKQLRAILPGRACFLSTRYVPVGFDELSNFGTGSPRFDGYASRSFKNREQDLEHAQRKKEERKASCYVYLGGISACGLNSVMILTH